MPPLPPYWFRPKRFWKWFAAYYPVSKQGWIAVLLFLTIFVYSFFQIDRASHSVSDTLIKFAPRALLIFVIFDLLTRLKGEYPWWWKERFKIKDKI